MSNFTDFLKSKEGIAAMAALTQTAASTWGGRAGQKELGEAGSEQKEAGVKVYETALKDLRSGRYDVSQAASDSAADTIQYAEEFETLTRDDKDAKRGDIVSALQSGDPRAISTVLEDDSSSSRAAALEALGIKVGANQTVADLRQAALLNQRELTEGEMERGGMAADAGRIAELEAMLKAKQAGPQGLQAGLQFGSALYSNLYDPKPDSPYKPEDDEDGEESNEDGGRAPNNGRTEGEFDHEENPIALVSEEGEKVGEVTGDELIFNPEQTQTIETLIESGNEGELIEFMRELLSLPQFAKNK